MKRFVSLLGAICLVGTQAVCSAESIGVYSDGGVSIERQAENIKAGTDVTVMVTESAASSSEGGQSTNPPTGVKYIEVKTAEDDGKYAFDFYLDKSGTYDCVVTSKDASDTFKIVYTNKDENAAMLSKIAAAENAATVESILKERGAAETLMLADDSIYTKVMADSTEKDGFKPSYKIAEIIYAAEQNSKITDPYEFITAAKRAALIVAINGDSSVAVANVDEYKDIILSDKAEISEYYVSVGAGYLTGILKSERITDIADLEIKLKNAIILTNIKYSDSIENTKAMLKLFSTDLNISESKLTTACVRSMQGKEFDSVKDIKSYVDAYDNSGDNNGNGGNSGGSSGSGGGSGKGSVSGAKYSDTYKNQDGGTEVNAPFKDMDDVDWAVPAVTALFTKGIINGKTADEFRPNDNITREEFVKLLIKTFELNVLGNGMNFEDVKEEDWYYDFVRSAYYADIVKGVSETMFGAGQNITRQDIAVMSCRAADVSGVKIAETAQEFTFADESDVAEYASDAVRLMQRGGIINGDENGNFNPEAYATRAEAAKIIYNLFLML